MTEEKGPDRDWKEYNEHLFRRGEILNVESLQGWQKVLQEMGLGKKRTGDPSDIDIPNARHNCGPSSLRSGGLTGG